MLGTFPCSNIIFLFSILSIPLTFREFDNFAVLMMWKLACITYKYYMSDLDLSCFQPYIDLPVSLVFGGEPKLDKR